MFVVVAAAVLGPHLVAITLCSGMARNGAGGQNVVPGTQLRLAMCKAIVLFSNPVFVLLLKVVFLFCF